MGDLLEHIREPIGVVECLRCVSREIAMRKQVYPRRVAKGDLSEAAASREIAVMEEIWRLLSSLPKPPAPFTPTRATPARATPTPSRKAA